MAVSGAFLLFFAKTVLCDHSSLRPLLFAAADMVDANLAEVEALLAATWPEGWHLSWFALQCAEDGVLNSRVLGQQMHRLFSKVVPGAAAAPALFAFSATLVSAALAGGAPSWRVHFARTVGRLLHDPLCSAAARSELAALVQGQGELGRELAQVQLIVV